jgi:GRAS domain family
MHNISMSNTFNTLSQFMAMSTQPMGDDAKNDIESFFEHCKYGMDQDSEKLLATLLLKALNKKIHSESIGENIYLGKYEVSQIQLFNILIEKFPFVRFSQQIVNNAIVEAMQDTQEVTIIDIGIGQGTQMMNLVSKAKSLQNLKKLHFVGIEPFGEALVQAEKNLLTCNADAPFQISFTGIHDGAENVDFTAIKHLLHGKVIVNASLALHHIQSAQQRTEILAQIRQINPAALLLIEPNVNHYEPDFMARFHNCYHHFYSIFQVIDRIEDIEQNDKNALKMFFGREIEDIIGKEEKDRYEKHELATNWIERLQQTRFSIQNNLLDNPGEAGCEVKIAHHKEGFVGFTFKNETVLAVICAN